MPQRPFRFIHAADLHLDRPVHGLAEAPEHLVDLLIDCPAKAADRVFDAAIDQHVDFVLLAGGIISPRHSSPQETMLLVEQFQRLAERSIAVYWAGGPKDLLEAWPNQVTWPANVRLFPRGRVERYRHQIDGQPVCEIIGRSHDPTGAGQPYEFSPTPGDLISLVVAHADWHSAARKEIGVNYWALGGNPGRSTPWETSHSVIHYSGSPQGSSPHQTGSHGCTLVAVDEQGCFHLTPISCDVVRWHAPRLTISETATRSDLEQLLRQRTGHLLEESNSSAMIHWTVSCHGLMLTALRRGQLSNELTAMLRSEFGHRSPPAWTIDLVAELPEHLPTAWHDEETLRGDYVRAVHALANADSPIAPNDAESAQLSLNALITPADLPPVLADKVGLSAEWFEHPHIRSHMLKETAWLGADLLAPEEAGT